MRSRSLRSRFALALALAAALSVGFSSFVPSTFACGTNAGAGDCKQAGSGNAPVRDRFSVDTIVAEIRAFFGL